MNSPAIQSRSARALLNRRRMSAEDRKRQILRSAIESFAQKGFSGTKTRDIAAAAGVSEAILFRHFGTKEDLYHAILDIKETREGMSQRIQDLEALAARRDDAALLGQLTAQTLRSFREDPAFHRLLLYAGLEGHLLASLFHERFGLPTGDFLRKYIALRQEEGAFCKCDPDTAVMFFFGSVVQYAMSRYLFDAQDESPGDEAVAAQLVELVLRGLVNSGHKRTTGKAVNATRV